MRLSPSYIQMGSQQRASGMPAISKPQAHSLHLLTSQSIIFPARLQSLPLLKQKPSVPVSDLTGSTGPLQPLSLASYSLSSLIWQPQADLPFLFLNSASMLPPACQYLTTLSRYITSPALNPTPSIARGCVCSIHFYQVPSIHSFLSTCVEPLLHLALGIQKWKIWSPESSWRERQDTVVCAMMLEHRV